MTVYAYDQGAGPLAGVLVGETPVRALVGERQNEARDVSPHVSVVGRLVESAFEAQERPPSE